MLRLIVFFFEDCVNSDQTSNRWSVPQRLDLRGRLVIVYLQQDRFGMAEEEFDIQWNYEQDNLSPDSSILAVHNERKFGFNSLVQDYARQLRKLYSHRSQSAELKHLISGTSRG